MRVLIDTNIILDFLQERKPFVEDAVNLFEKIDAGEIEGFISATTITNIYYIIRKSAGIEVAENAISQILNDLQICKVDRTILEQAVALKFRDFEDAVQYACAMAYGVDAIATRDIADFIAGDIPVKLPRNL